MPSSRTYARNHSRFLINDILYLSAQVGLAAWFRSSYWYNFHMAVSPTATVALARNVAAIVKSVYGKSKKCLVLDLDNTLWGGVIGDDGCAKSRFWVKTTGRRGLPGLPAICERSAAARRHSRGLLEERC